MKADHQKGSDENDRLDQDSAVVAAIQRAVRQALIEHKQSGDPIVICEGDEVRWIPADEIVIPEPESD